MIEKIFKNEKIHFFSVPLVMSIIHTNIFSIFYIYMFIEKAVEIIAWQAWFASPWSFYVCIRNVNPVMQRRLHRLMLENLMATSRLVLANNIFFSFSYESQIFAWIPHLEHPTDMVPDLLAQ